MLVDRPTLISACPTCNYKKTSANSKHLQGYQGDRVCWVAPLGLLLPGSPSLSTCWVAEGLQEGKAGVLADLKLLNACALHKCTPCKEHA